MDSTLQTPIAPAKKKKPKWRIPLYILGAVALLYGGTVGGTIAYFNLSFDLPIFINGLSMYPFLNADGEKYENGHYRKYVYNDGNAETGDIVDFGYAKSLSKLNAKTDLKRYDIIMTYYPSDYKTNTDGSLARDSSGHLTLLLGASPKIKRIIALPKEKLTYTVVSEEGEYANPIWGETLITSETYPNGEKLKPLYKISDYHIWDGKYNYPKTSYGWAAASALDNPSFSLQLNENEFVVAGDNRGYSSDSLSKRFAVTSEMIVGKVYFIAGRAKMVSSGGGNSIDAGYGFAFAPWSIRRIG